MEQDLLRITTAGSVDDGKSTLIGRMLVDSHSVYQDHLQAIEKASHKRGAREPDLAFLLDGLAAEREQGITIDVAYRFFSTPKRRFIIADVPGHEQYTHNMATGASVATLALLLVDAQKELVAQTKRHLTICSLLHVSHLLIVINKMDQVGYRKEQFENIKENILLYSQKLHIKDIQFIPVSALKGDMIVERHTNMPWYQGSTLLSYLENVPLNTHDNTPYIRLPIQTVLRGSHSKRFYAGRLNGGILKKGDAIIVLSRNHKEARTHISSIWTPQGEKSEAYNGESIKVTLHDELEVGRGSMLVSPQDTPCISTQLDATIFWMSHKPLEINKTYLIKHTTTTTRCTVSAIQHRLHLDSLKHEQAQSLSFNDIGYVSLSMHEKLFCDTYINNTSTGSFIMIDPDSFSTIGMGVIQKTLADVCRHPRTKFEHKSIHQKCYFIGGGNHAGVLVEILSLNDSIFLSGYVDILKTKLGLAFIRETSNDLPRPDASIVLVNGIGSTKSTHLRKIIYEKYCRQGFEFLSVIHPTSIISQSSKISQGAHILAGTIIGTNVHIKSNTIINTGTIIDHDCIIGNHSHIAPGCTLSGQVTIGDECHIGTGTTIIQNISIGRGCIIGAGSVVTQNIPAFSIAVGVPARIINSNNP